MQIRNVCMGCAMMLLAAGAANAEGQGGYLFAHMIPGNYGHLYYSISRDGLAWTALNNGKSVLPNYLGHPDIVRGGDGQWHSIGVKFGQGVPVAHPIHWHSKDLVTWEMEPLPADIMAVSHLGQRNDGGWFGAPKTCYDPDTQQYVITWHASKEGLVENTALWESMRTVYILTKDFKSFSKAQFLFDFSGDASQTATIDTNLRKLDGTYYAILKDERWPQHAATGKTIRLAKSKGGVLGPYENPGPSVTPTWREAPSIVKAPNGHWRVYAEDYGACHYETFEAESPQGPWKKVDTPPPAFRHGCVVPIDEATWQRLIDAFGETAPKP